jgi:hypothetical protein
MTYYHIRKLHNDHRQNICCIHCVATFPSYLKPLTMRTDYPKQHFLNKYEMLHSFIFLLVHHALLNIWHKLLQYLRSLLFTRMYLTVQCPSIFSNNYITLLLPQHNNEAKQFQQLSITWYIQNQLIVQHTFSRICSECCSSLRSLQGSHKGFVNSRGLTFSKTGCPSLAP